MPRPGSGWGGGVFFLQCIWGHARGSNLAVPLRPLGLLLGLVLGLVLSLVLF